MNDDHADSGFPEGLDPRELSALIDGELPGARRAELEAQLSKHPRDAARVAAWRAQKAALRALCGVRQPHDSADEEAPSGTAARSQRGTTRSTRSPLATGAADPAVVVLRRHAPWWQRVGVAACWLALGAGFALALGPLAPRLTGGAWNGVLPAGWSAVSGPPGFAQRADIAYAVYTPERRHPVEVAASEEAHLIGWLSKRLNRPLSVPSLQDYGYTLVGGRLLPGEAGPAAQFMYENNAGARVTLYVAGTPRDETAFRLLRDGNRHTFYWVNDGMGYALSGPIAEARLREIAIDVCGELGGHPQAWQ